MAYDKLGLKTGEQWTEEVIAHIEDGIGDAARVADGADAALTDKADRSDIPDVSGFAMKSEIPEVPDISGKADKSEIPDVSGLATQADLNAAIGRIDALEAAAEPDEG